MRWIRLVKIALVTASFWLAVSITLADQPGDFATNMSGSWRVMRYSYNNRTIPSGNLTIYISGDKMTFLSAGNAGATNFKLDVSRAPAWFDLIDNSEGRRVYKGICTVNGDRMTLAYNTNGGERPSRFGGDKMIVMELVRDGSLTTQPTTNSAVTTRP
jgi:uncharacterized protein (TIGR03067 family)